MSYTPTTWMTGDTITATKLNKLEQGVTNAGGRSNLFFEVTTTNFPANSNNTIGYFIYVKKSGNTYTWANMVSSGGDTIAVTGNKTGYCWFTMMPIPTLENYYLVLSPNSGVEFTAFEGGIESTPITVNGNNVYIITDDFAITAKGWL